MDITYIYHSAFSVELAKHILLFDYVKGELPIFSSDKKLIVFVSHAHADHYDQKIFNLRKQYQHIQFVLSDDVSIPSVQDCIFVKVHEQYQLSDVGVTTLASTDAGVAYVVQVEGKTIYHGGDLNWWDWGSEDTAEESEAMKQQYLAEISSLANEQIDVAFVPLDPRLKEAFSKGMDAFIQCTHTKTIFPMHCWEDYKIIEKMKALTKKEGISDNIQMITQCNQKFHL